MDVSKVQCWQNTAVREFGSDPVYAAFYPRRLTDGFSAGAARPSRPDGREGGESRSAGQSQHGSSPRSGQPHTRWLGKQGASPARGRRSRSPCSHLHVLWSCKSNGATNETLRSQSKSSLKPIYRKQDQNQQDTAGRGRLYH